LGPKLARSARAALRETWEEAGVLIGRTGSSPPPISAALPIEHAYRDRGLVAAMDVLTYVSRAITPFRSFRRFTPGSFSATAATYSASDGERRTRGRRLAPDRARSARIISRRDHAGPGDRVTRAGPSGEAPLFYWAKNARRIGVYRKAVGTI